MKVYHFHFRQLYGSLGRRYCVFTYGALREGETEAAVPREAELIQSKDNSR